MFFSVATFITASECNYQVCYVETKLNIINSLVNEQKDILPTRVRITLDNRLFLSISNCCHLAWGTTPLQNTHKLIIAQKKVHTNYRKFTVAFSFQRLLPNSQYSKNHILIQLSISTSTYNRSGNK